MKEINIAGVIMGRRKEKGITQDELAGYIGVSKASVSKWETGQSYPDITFLPLLAAYFDISIDDLMGYEPQMTKRDIRKLYRELSADFASKPFEEVMGRCREIIKKYYSCYPLLFQIGVLWVNNSSVPKEEGKAASILMEAAEIFVRVKEQSGDVELSKQALCLEAVCALALGQPEKVLALLEETNAPQFSTDSLLAAAYQMTGKVKEAKSVLQAGMYQHILGLFGLLTAYLPLCADDPALFGEICKRAEDMIGTFRLKELHPAVLFNLYLAAAQGYAAQSNKEKSLDFLERYTEIATGGIYPLRLKGDEFFNLLDDWMEDFPLGTAMPRDEKIIRQSMAEAVAENPMFTAFLGDRRFRRIAERLRENM